MSDCRVRSECLGTGKIAQWVRVLAAKKLRMEVQILSIHIKPGHGCVLFSNSGTGGPRRVFCFCFWLSSHAKTMSQGDKREEGSTEHKPSFSDINIYGHTNLNTHTNHTFLYTHAHMIVYLVD